MPGARVFGVVAGTDAEPSVAWLERPVPVTPELLAKTGAVEPQRIFRITAACQESKCTHFDGSRCKLVRRIVNLLPAVVDGLPPCSLRADCRWFTQEGRAACVRCPQVVTHSYEPTEKVIEAATPA